VRNDLLGGLRVPEPLQQPVRLGQRLKLYCEKFATLNSY
jgi:hypothetical protein